MGLVAFPRETSPQREYSVREATNDMKVLEQTLNELASAGWRVVGVLATSDIQQVHVAVEREVF